MSSLCLLCCNRQCRCSILLMDLVIQSWAPITSVFCRQRASGDIQEPQRAESGSGQALVGTGCGYRVHLWVTGLCQLWAFPVKFLIAASEQLCSQGVGRSPCASPSASCRLHSVLWLYLLPCLPTSETLWLSCRKPSGSLQKWETAVSEMCSTWIYRCSDLELVRLEITITEAKQSQAAFKRGSKNKQACTSLFLDAFIIPMVWKWGCN